MRALALVDAAHAGAAEVVYFNPPSDERAHFVIKLIALRRVPVQYLYEPLFPGCQFILSGRLYQGEIAHYLQATGRPWWSWTLVELT